MLTELLDKIDWDDLHSQDAMVAGGLGILGILCLASGRCDESLLFVTSSLVFGTFVAVKVPHLGVQEMLEEFAGPKYQIDLMGLTKSQIGMVPDTMDEETEGLMLCAIVLFAALLVSLLAKRTLAKYSPVLCVILYCACVSTILRDKTAVERAPVQVVILGCIVTLSLFSNHILRLHVAASLFCCCLVIVHGVTQDSIEGGKIKVGSNDDDDGNYLQESGFDIGKEGPFGVTFCLVVGFGSCLLHDLLVNCLLVTFTDLSRIIYVLLTTFVSVDFLLEVGFNLNPSKLKFSELSWATTCEKLLQLHKLDLCLSEMIGVIAPTGCVVFSATMIVRRLISPHAVWKPGKFNEALGTAFGACFGFGIWIFVENHLEHSFYTDRAGPVILTVLSALLYIQISRLTDLSVTNGNQMKWYTMTYWRDGFPKDEKERIGIPSTGSKQEPPPFVLKGHEDIRVKGFIEKLEKQQKIALTASQELGTAQSRVKEMKENGKKFNEYESSLLHVGRKHLNLVFASAKEALLAEDVAKGLRELASDAETELYILHGLRQRENEHEMVVKRQMTNAATNFNWLSREMEEAETNAEKTLEQARSRVRAGIQHLASCRAEFSKNKAKADRVKLLDEMIGELRTKLDSFVVDSDFLNYLFGNAEQHWFKQLGLQTSGYYQNGNASQAQNSGSNNDNGGYRNPGSASTGSGGSGPKPNKPSTPYEVAMMQKHGPNILAADEVGSEPSNRGESDDFKNVTGQSESQRKRRGWWPFSSSSSGKEKKKEKKSKRSKNKRL